MDELEWLRKKSPPTEPSRDTTRRHRTQLRAAIATEGAAGARPRRPRRGLHVRHRVLVTSVVVVVLCVAGAGVIALASRGGDGGGQIGAPAASGSTPTTTAVACIGQPPAQLDVPAGFGSGVAAPAAQATTQPASTQQVTSWSSQAATIEQRWPADAGQGPWSSGRAAPPNGAIASVADSDVTLDGNGTYHRSVFFSFPNQAQGCETLQITVYGSDKATVGTLSNDLIRAPFRSPQPLVTTTAAAAAAPTVAACEAVARNGTTGLAAPAIATTGGGVALASFAQPADALAQFLASRRQLIQHGYEELHLDDGSITYAEEVRPGVVVTTVHVSATKSGWSVDGWAASGC